MANRYWVGGSGTWNTSATTNWSSAAPLSFTASCSGTTLTTTGSPALTIGLTVRTSAFVSLGTITGGSGNSWTVSVGGTQASQTMSAATAGASVPTAADSVFFQLPGTYSITMTGALLCLDITVSAGTVTFSVGTSPTLAISGSMSLIAGTVWPVTDTAFVATTTGKTVTTNGVVIGQPTFNGVGGGWSLGSALTASGTTTLTNGALDLNGFNISTNIFNSNNANTRSLAFGSNFIFLTSGTAGTTVVSMATTTGLTVSGTGGFSAAMSVTRTFTCGSTANNGLTGAPNLFLTSGSSVPTFTSQSWWNTLDITGTTCSFGTSTQNLRNLTLATGGGTYNAFTAVMRGTGTITNLGKGIGALTINHTGTTTLTSNLACALSTSYTQTAGTIDFAGFNLTCTGTATFTSGTLSNIGTISCTTFTVTTGTFDFTQGTITPSTSFTVTGSGTFNYNGGTLSSVSLFTFTSGTLNLNSNNITATEFVSNNSNVRTINFGATGSITIGGTGLTMNTMTNLTMTGSRYFYAASTQTRTIATGVNASGGGYTTNGVKLIFTGTGTSLQTFSFVSNQCYFDLIDFGTSSVSVSVSGALNVNSATFSATGPTLSGLNFLGTGTLISNGKTLSGLTIANVNGVTTLGDALSHTGSTMTLTSGGFDLNGFNCSCNTWSSSGTSSRSIAFGSNYINLTGTTGTVLSMATATGFSATGTGGFRASVPPSSAVYTCGTTGAPTAAPSLFFTTGTLSGATVTTGGYFGNLDFGTTTFALNVSTSLNLTGLVLSASGSTASGITATMIGSGTLNGNGKTLTALTINHSGTTTITGNLTTSGNTTLTQGAIAFSGSPTLTIPSFISVGPSVRSITGAGIITVSSAWTVTNGTNFTGSGYTINMTSATGKTFAGGTGGAAYGTLVQAGAGALTISGSNTFDDIQASTRPSTITFTASTTQTLANLTLSGTAGNLVTLNSTTNGTRFNLSKASGTVVTNYLSIRDSNATGGAAFYAQTSTDVSNNLGWIFALAPATNSQFMAFFF